LAPRDVSFAFSPAVPVVLDDATTELISSALANRTVTVRVTPHTAGAVRYTRPITTVDDLVFPEAGRAGEALYVQSTVAKCTRAKKRAGSSTSREIGATVAWAAFGATK
jgi:hypothetical protein